MAFSDEIMVVDKTDALTGGLTLTGAIHSFSIEQILQFVRYSPETGL